MSSITIEKIKSDYPWINDQLFLRIIQKELHPNAKTIDIVDFTAKGALPHGENYGSQMIRVKVNYQIDGEQETQEFRAVVKATMADEKLKKVINDFGIFQRETKLYGDVMLDVHKFMLEVGDSTQITPRCYEANYDESYLIFEDLSARNYRNVDRVKGLDFEHQKLVMIKLAKWHAVTALLLSKNVTFPDFQKHPMDYSPLWKDIVNSSIKTAAIVADRNPQLRHLSQKLHRLRGTILEKVRQAVSRDDQTFIVLCHGDLWSNNIMFEYNDQGQPIDAILLDFQISFVGPAILDISNDLFSASNEDLQDREWDLLLQEYHCELKNTLIKLNYTKAIPTLTEFQCQFVNRSVCSVPLGMMAVCGRVADDVDKNDVTTFTGNTAESEEYLVNMFENPKCKKCFEFLLDYFDRKGFLD